MTREEIYDHLAQVYLGKRKKAEATKKKQFGAWLVINICITMIIFASAFYGLSAFFTKQGNTLKNGVIYPLHHGSFRMEYDFVSGVSPTTIFTLDVPPVAVSQYKNVHFSIRAKEEGSPGTVKIVINNALNEHSSFYIQDVGLKWQEYDIPLEKFVQITDWSSLTNIDFVLESWNVDDKKGLILIDNVAFSSAQ